MSEIVRFVRRITVEEADSARIRVRRELVEALTCLGRELQVTVCGRSVRATLDLDLCQCAGISRPHRHHVLLLEGNLGLLATERHEIEVRSA